MSFEREIDSLMGFETSISGAKGVVPAYLESHYNRLGAVENIRESGHASSSMKTGSDPRTFDEAKCIGV